MDNPTYNPKEVLFMREELTAVGFTEVFTIEEVDKYIANKKDETVLVAVNSVCGCSAGCARPGVGAALQNDKIPDHSITLLAGQEKTAINHIRDTYLSDYNPSSPNMILFKNGKILKFFERIHIQELTAETLADQLVDTFNEHCTKTGPSVPKEEYDKLSFTITCGSKISRV
ncbi:MAG TPA: BrxA/BrxB family bacilliredoxin [Spirochaetes bacterium]|nr:BrxA/BrxB family bacilliredoxin [Spirochaetota bacterium]